MTRIFTRENFSATTSGARIFLQIAGELVCFRASLKESDMAIGTNQVEERTLRAVQAREIAVKIFEAFGRWHLCAVRQDDERPDMQRRECAGNFLVVLAGAEQRDHAAAPDQLEQRNLLAGFLENNVRGAIAGPNANPREQSIEMRRETSAAIIHLELRKFREHSPLHERRAQDRNEQPLADEARDRIHGEDNARDRARAVKHFARNRLAFLVVSIEE